MYPTGTRTNSVPFSHSLFLNLTSECTRALGYTRRRDRREYKWSTSDLEISQRIIVTLLLPSCIPRRSAWVVLHVLTANGPCTPLSVRRDVLIGRMRGICRVALRSTVNFNSTFLEARQHRRIGLKVPFPSLLPLSSALVPFHVLIGIPTTTTTTTANFVLLP